MGNFHPNASSHVAPKVKYVCNTKVSNLREPFAKVVIVVRNPYDTIWEAYMLVKMQSLRASPEPAMW
jgi:hypothetical protein